MFCRGSAQYILPLFTYPKLASFGVACTGVEICLMVVRSCLSKQGFGNRLCQAGEEFVGTTEEQILIITATCKLLVT